MFLIYLPKVYKTNYGYLLLFNNFNLEIDENMIELFINLAKHAKQLYIWSGCQVHF